MIGPFPGIACGQYNKQLSEFSTSQPQLAQEATPQCHNPQKQEEEDAEQNLDVDSS
jgi:hypothetical protein